MSNYKLVAMFSFVVVYLWYQSWTTLFNVGFNFWCSVIGATTIGIGFYTMTWAHSEKNDMVNENYENCDFVPSSSAPLLSTKNMDV